MFPSLPAESKRFWRCGYKSGLTARARTGRGDAPRNRDPFRNLHEIAQLNNQVVLLHHGHEVLERDITMPDGSRRPVTLPPNSIAALDR